MECEQPNCLLNDNRRALFDTLAALENSTCISIGDITAQGIREYFDCATVMDNTNAAGSTTQGSN